MAILDGEVEHYIADKHKQLLKRIKDVKPEFPKLNGNQEKDMKDLIKE